MSLSLYVGKAGSSLATALLHGTDRQIHSKQKECCDISSQVLETGLFSSSLQSDVLSMGQADIGFVHHSLQQETFHLWVYTCLVPWLERRILSSTHGIIMTCTFPPFTLFRRVLN